MAGKKVALLAGVRVVSMVEKLAVQLVAAKADLTAALLGAMRAASKAELTDVKRAAKKVALRVVVLVNLKCNIYIGLNIIEEDEDVRKWRKMID